MSRVLQYIEKVDIYPSEGQINYAVNELTVNYVVPVCPGSTYIIAMDEVGNRLRAVFTTTNPLTLTSTISGCTNIVMNPSFAVGYTFSYTPSAYGYIVVYVSNAGERPNITIATDGVGGDEKYTVMCTETTSGTSLTGSIYARAGDFVFCTLTTRSDTTLPEGWTVLAISQTTTSSTQHMSLLYKKVETDGMVDFVVKQASSARIYINLIAFSGIAGFRYSGGEYFYNSDTHDSFAIDRPVFHTVLWAMSSNLWSTTSPYSPWTCAEITSPVITLPSTTQRRQANFVDEDGGSFRTFVPGTTGTSAIIMCVQVIDGEYNSEGSCEVSIEGIRVISNVTSSYISWESDTPDGTAVRLYAKMSEGEYIECVDGEAIPCVTTGDDLSQATLYLKAVLTTVDGSVTPVLKAVRIQLYDLSDRNIIMLVFDPGVTNSIQRAAGDITVAYDGSGTLVGEGGPVEAFEYEFAPKGLDPKNNPNLLEHVAISSLEADGYLMRVYYADAAEREHVSISGLSAIGVLTSIDDL